VSLVAFGALGLDVAGPCWAVGLLAIGNATLGMALGLFVSAVAATEFQAVQFMPALVLPQLLLSGLFVARDQMAAWLQWVSDAMPLVYAYEALAPVARGGPYDSGVAADVAITAGRRSSRSRSAPRRYGGGHRRVVSMHAFEVAAVVERLRTAGGGYEVVHESPGLEVGVYVLIAPEADRQQPHEDDEIYVGLDGTGVLEVEGKRVPIEEGAAIFVDAGADHRFTAYEHLAVLVLFERGSGARRTAG
jgi:mannose-6-phosphate isomerase-like protein (cupin superfamily)